MRNYRIVRLAPINYPKAIQKMYKEDPALCCLDYSQQQKLIFDQYCVYSDAFSWAMNRQGNEAVEILFDFEPLQKAWARENDVLYSEDNWQLEIAAAQLKAMRPDVVYFQGGSSISFSLGSYIKQQLKYIKCVFLCSGFPGRQMDLTWLDGAFVAAPYLLKPYLDQGIEAHVAYHAFDERILSRLESNNEKQYNFTFAGSSGFGVHKGHNQRFWMLLKLMKETPLEVWVEEQLGQRELTRKLLKQAGCREDIEKVSTYMLGLTFRPKTVDELVSIWPQFMAHLHEAVARKIPNQEGFPILPLAELFPDRCHDPVFGLAMYRLLHDSKIIFNKHTTVGGGQVGAMRLFEATGTGACMVSDDGSNMGEIFERDSEIVVYNSYDECVEKVNYLLNHDRLRHRIASAGQQRVLRDHTVRLRCEQIDLHIQRVLSRQGCLI